MIDNNKYQFDVKYGMEIRDSGMTVITKPTREGNNFTAKYVAYGPSFEIVSKILEDSTYANHITGEGFALASKLYENVFRHAIVSISFPGNDSLSSINIADNDFMKLQYRLIKIIAQHWLKEVL